MPAKRAHKKSRNGCGVCRARRVKCDEVKPECGPCKKHEVKCNYDRETFTPVRASSSNSASPSTSTARGGHSLWRKTPFQLDYSPPAFGTGLSSARMAELQLMNHYTYMHICSTSSADPRVRRMWVYDVPQRAVDCEFLMQAILSFSALHLHIFTPNDSRIRDLSHYYFGTALRMFTSSLSSLEPGNGDMAFAASILIQFQVFMNWKDPCVRGQVHYEPPVTWLEMSQGVNSLMKQHMRGLQYSCMRPLIEVGPHLLLRGGIYPLTQAQADASAEGYEAPFAAMGHYLATENRKNQWVVKEAFDLVHTIYQFHVTGDNSMWTRRRMLAFPIALSSDFVVLLRDQDPRALVVLAYYFAVMKVVEDIWWFSGRPEHEISGICSILPEHWRTTFLEWPLEMIAGASLGDVCWEQITDDSDEVETIGGQAKTISELSDAATSPAG